MSNNFYRLWKKGNYFHKKNCKLLEFIMRCIMLLLYPATDIPFETKMGENIIFPHRAIGVIIHKNAEIGDNTKILPNTVIGGRYKKGVPINSAGTSL